MLNTRYSGRSDAPEIDCVTVAATPSARSRRERRKRSRLILQRIAEVARRVHSALVDQPACISTVCYQMTCEVLSTRYSGRQTRPRSIASRSRIRSEQFAIETASVRASALLIRMS
eukprot:1598104-Prymnesium_polylepis.3